MTVSLEVENQPVSGQFFSTLVVAGLCYLTVNICYVLFLNFC